MVRRMAALLAALTLTLLAVTPAFATVPLHQGGDIFRQSSAPTHRVEIADTAVQHIAVLARIVGAEHPVERLDPRGL